MRTKNLLIVAFLLLAVATEGEVFKCNKDEFRTCARGCANDCLEEGFGGRLLTSNDHDSFSFPTRLRLLEAEEDIGVTSYAAADVDSCQERVREYQACLSRNDPKETNTCIDCMEARVPQNAEFCYELWDIFCRGPKECCESCQEEVQNVLECYYVPCEADVTCALSGGDGEFPPRPSCTWESIEQCIDLECVAPVFESSQSFSSKRFVRCVTECSDPCLVDGRRLHATPAKEGDHIPSFRALTLSKNIITPYQDGLGGGFCQSKTDAYRTCLSEQGTTYADQCIRCLNRYFPPENPVFCYELYDLVCDAPRNCGCAPCQDEIELALECSFPPCKHLCSEASDDKPGCDSRRSLNSCIENCLEPCLQPIKGGSGW